MATGKLKDDLLETVELFLQGLGEPIHYKTLTELLIGAGAEVPGKEPDQVLYSRMHNDVKRRGEASPIRFLGQGVFCASTVKGVDLVAKRKEELRNDQPSRQKGHVAANDPYAADKRKALAEDACCGNCVSMEFFGPYEITRTHGLCGNPASGRAGADSCAAPCGHWKRRTLDQDRSLDRQRDEVLKACFEAAKEHRVNLYGDVLTEPSARLRPWTRSR